MRGIIEGYSATSPRNSADQSTAGKQKSPGSISNMHGHCGRCVPGQSPAFVVQRPLAGLDSARLKCTKRSLVDARDRLQAALLGPGQAQIVPRTFRTHGLVGTTGSSNNLRCDSVTPKALQVLRPGFAEEMTSRQAACTACRSCPIDRPIS